MDARERFCAGIALLALCLLPCPARADWQPRPGDLLFQDLDAGPLCDAIEAVTEGIDGAKFSHVGIAALDANGAVEVLEASGPGVRAVPLADFLARSRDADGHPKVLVGRVDDEALALAGVARARKLLGTPYDGEFLLNNGKYYCSELVHDCYLDADGRPIFKLFPMTFKEPGTDRTFPAWEQYFRERGQPVPEGEPGCNPGGLSRSERVRIVHGYGRPEGYEAGG